ncbi:MAG: 5'-3' exonuclease H3TH domain-containing protein [Myxococcota bacterium]
MRVHLVDGTFELFRAHYSKRPSVTAPDGQDVKATVGVLRSLLNLFTEEAEQATHVAVAFDNPIRSFRNDLFDGYKTGEGMEEVLVAQMDLVERATAAMGIAVWSMDQWEADDGLATGAVRFVDQVEQVRIMTPDKDLGQVVDGSKIVQVDRIRSKVIDEDGVKAARGVGPASIPDYLALVGDTADGIPGLAGFGAKSSATLLAHYEHLESIPDDPTQWAVKVRGAARLGGTLAAQRDDAMLYRTLATLKTDVPLTDALEDLRWTGPTSGWEQVCTSLGQDGLRRQAEALASRRG